MIKKAAGLPDLALGSYEAACVTGTQFTRPARLAKEGKLVYRPLASGWGVDGVNEFFLYSLHDCDENYREYIDAMAAGGVRGRKRSDECLASRAPMLARLREVEPILYDDAIGTAEAASIMGVHITLVNRLIREGKLRARKAMNDRHDGGGSVYIVSRRAAEANRAKYAAMESSGSKSGIPRQPSGSSPKVKRSAPVKKRKS